MAAPIETMLDNVEWEAVAAEPVGDLPYATHQGVLRFGEASLRVYQLNDGQRIIDEADLLDFFGISEP